MLKKTVYPILLAAMIAIGFSCAVTVPYALADDVVTIVTPVSGEELAAGSSYEIMYESLHGFLGPVELSYRLGQAEYVSIPGTPQVISAMQTSEGYMTRWGLNWDVPDVEAESCTIRAEYEYMVNIAPVEMASGSSQSGYFSISKGKTPDGNDSPVNNTSNSSIAPFNLTVKAVSPYEVKLEWSIHPEYEGYLIIERQTGDSSSWSEVSNELTSNTISWSEWDLEPGQAYSYRVKAMYTGHAPAYSNTARITMPSTNGEPTTGNTTESTTGNNTNSPSSTDVPEGTTLLEFIIGQTGYLVNGQQYYLDAAPEIRDESILLPIRFVVEPLGGSAEWDGIEQKVSIYCNGHVIFLWIGQNEARVDGASKLIDSANPALTPVIINERILVPLRFAGESLDCDVQWDDPRSTAIISYPKL